MPSPPAPAMCYSLFTTIWASQVSFCSGRTGRDTYKLLLTSWSLDWCEIWGFAMLQSRLRTLRLEQCKQTRTSQKWEVQHVTWYFSTGFFIQVVCQNSDEKPKHHACFVEHEVPENFKGNIFLFLIDITLKHEAMLWIKSILFYMEFTSLITHCNGQTKAIRREEAQRKGLSQEENMDMPQLNRSTCKGWQQFRWTRINIKLT